MKRFALVLAAIIAVSYVVGCVVGDAYGQTANDVIFIDCDWSEPEVNGEPLSNETWYMHYRVYWQIGTSWYVHTFEVVSTQSIIEAHDAPLVAVAGIPNWDPANSINILWAVDISSSATTITDVEHEDSEAGKHDVRGYAYGPLVYHAGSLAWESQAENETLILTVD